MQATLLLSLLGLILGILSSLLGIGGGSILVPALMSAYPTLEHTSVTSTSLVFIFFSCFINIIAYRNSGVTFIKRIVLITGISCFISAILAGFINLSISRQTYNLIFGGLMLAIALRLLLNKDQKGIDEKATIIPKIADYKYALTGVFTGAISSLTGLGGGILIIPVFTTVFKFPVRAVSLYSNAIMLFSVLGALMPHLMAPAPKNISNLFIFRYCIGDIPIILALSLFPLSWIGAKIGVKLNSVIGSKTKKISYGVLLICVGIKMLYNTALFK